MFKLLISKGCKWQAVFKVHIFYTMHLNLIFIMAVSDTTPYYVRFTNLWWFWLYHIIPKCKDGVQMGMMDKLSDGLNLFSSEVADSFWCSWILAVILQMFFSKARHCQLGRDERHCQRPLILLSLKQLSFLTAKKWNRPRLDGSFIRMGVSWKIISLFYYYFTFYFTLFILKQCI